MLADLRRRLRLELHTRGLEVPRRGGLDGTMRPALRRIATRFQPASVIDVGVAWGTPGLLAAFPKARFLLVEPLAEFTPALERIAARYDARYELTAAGAEPGSMTVRVQPDLSSSGHHRPTGEDPSEARVVPVSTVDDLAERHALDGPCVIKIDVQGAEHEVLDGATRTLERTELIILETSLLHLYEGAPTLAETIAYLGERGFAVYDVFGGDRRPLDGALAQVDVVFAATEGSLRADHRYAETAAR